LELIPFVDKWVFLLSTQTDPFIIKRYTIRPSTFEQDGKHVELVEKEWAEICDCMKEYKNKDKDPEGE
jgi:hypothetical protein